MIETEVKILEINKGEILKKLKKLGAKGVYRGNVFTVQYDVKDKTLRIRKFSDKVVLTFKSKIKQNNSDGSGYKVMNEKEVVVDNFIQMKKILVAMGYRVKATTSKYRTSYETKDAHFDIDEINGIPVYMEIEGTTEIIDKYLSLLDVDKMKVKDWDTNQLLAYYRNKKDKKMPQKDRSNKSGRNNYRRKTRN